MQMIKNKSLKSVSRDKKAAESGPGTLKAQDAIMYETGTTCGLKSQKWHKSRIGLITVSSRSSFSPRNQPYIVSSMHTHKPTVFVDTPKKKSPKVFWSHWCFLFYHTASTKTLLLFVYSPRQTTASEDDRTLLLVTGVSDERNKRQKKQSHKPYGALLISQPSLLDHNHHSG